VSETLEKVTAVSDTDLDGEPTCEGMSVTYAASGSIVHEDCDRPATWQKTTHHCGVRSKLVCDLHFKASSSMVQSCLRCGTLEIKVTWRRL